MVALPREPPPDVAVRVTESPILNTELAASVEE